MVKNGCFCVSEGANMPSNLAAIKVYQGNNVLYGPGQGGQRRRRRHLRPGDGPGEPCASTGAAKRSTRTLHSIMKSIHKQCLDAAEKYGSKGDYLTGANIAGFIKVAKSMLAYGIV